MSLIVHSLGRQTFPRTLEFQEELLARKVQGESDDHLIFVEHDPVFTLGRGADASDLRHAGEILGIPVHRISRGGGATFHGPGQLVAYPILTLPKAGRDVHRYVRTLEEVLLSICREFGLSAERIEGKTGVWIGARKIASIGVGVRRWTTFHGIALNVSTDLRYFDQIVPCRMPDVQMTTMAIELGYAPTLETIQTSFERSFRCCFRYGLEEQEERAAAFD